MNTKDENSRTMFNLINSYYRLIKGKSLAKELRTKNYYELNWDDTYMWAKYANAFKIKPKAGATKARTLYERMQKYICV